MFANVEQRAGFDPDIYLSLLLNFKFRSVATFGDGSEFPWQQEVFGCAGIILGHQSRKTLMSTHASACPHTDVHTPSSTRGGSGSSLQRSDIAILMTLVVNIITCNLTAVFCIDGGEQNLRNMGKKKS